MCLPDAAFWSTPMVKYWETWWGDAFRSKNTIIHHQQLQALRIHLLLQNMLILWLHHQFMPMPIWWYVENAWWNLEKRRSSLSWKVCPICFDWSNDLKPQYRLHFVQKLYICSKSKTNVPSIWPAILGSEACNKNRNMNMSPPRKKSFQESVRTVL